MSDTAESDAVELRQARRQVLFAAALGVFGNAVGGSITYALQGWKLGNTLRVIHGCLCLIILLFVFLRRDLSARWLMAAFSILVVPILPFLVVWTITAPDSHAPEAFVAFKMVIMGVALLAPLSLRFGLVLTIATTVEAVLIWGFSLSGRVPSEPWVTIFYSVFACGLLVHRAAERNLARRLLRMAAESAALERIAVNSLRVRDRINTPLQTLALNLYLLERRTSSGGTDNIVRMKNAVASLTSLSSQLAADSDP
jgi:hypothetical protein